MNIGQRLHELRTAKGFSQGDIEKRTGLLRCYVSRVENGHTIPSLGTLRKWSTALEIEMYQLFFEGKGKPAAAAQKEVGKPGPQERRLLDSFKKIGDKDRRLVMGMVAKLARHDRSGTN